MTCASLLANKSSALSTYIVKKNVRSLKLGQLRLVYRFMIKSVKLASSSSSSNQPPKNKEDFVTIVSTVVFMLISSSVANHVPATSMVDSYNRIHHLKEGLDICLYIYISLLDSILGCFAN